jgi:hypothetical protein
MEEMCGLLGFICGLIGVGIIVYGYFCSFPYEKELKELKALEKRTKEERILLWRLTECKKHLFHPCYILAIPFILWAIGLFQISIDPIAHDCTLIIVAVVISPFILIFSAIFTSCNVSIRHDYGFYDKKLDISDRVSAGICLHGAYKTTKHALGSNKRQTEYFKNSKNKV